MRILSLRQVPQCICRESTQGSCHHNVTNRAFLAVLELPKINKLRGINTG
jgi:hypothetical protein